MKIYTAFFPFCGVGGGASGFKEARGHLKVKGFDHEAQFRIMGGVDIDPLACQDFENLTGAKALCADIATLTSEALIAAFGKEGPDVVFDSAPCKASSKLINNEKAQQPHYEKMNLLSEIWTRLMFKTWGNRPRLILKENVPNILNRAKPTLQAIHQMQLDEGYEVHPSLAHGKEGIHNLGAQGNLGQNRFRILFVGRQKKSVPEFLRKPRNNRVRACGEVIGELPTVGDERWGKLHKIPNCSWLTWVRLAAIPAGKDWKDLPPWLMLKEVSYPHTYGVLDEKEPAHVISGNTVAGGGPFSVADHNAKWYGGILGVSDWNAPAPTITGMAGPTTGAYSVNDVQLGCKPYEGTYKVLSWDQAAATITAAGTVDAGASAVAAPLSAKTPRFNNIYSVIDWKVPCKVVTGGTSPSNGALSIGDPRKPMRHDKPIIIALDGTWHRPFTLLELAALQGFSIWMPDGSPLRLSGRAEGKWRERIGNAVPPPAAKAIAEQMLLTLLASDAETMILSNSAIWVSSDTTGETQWTHPIQ